MKSFIKVLTAGLVAVAFSAGTASAQNVIRNSGNGQFNTINVQGGGFGTSKVIGSGNGFGNTINVGQQQTPPGYGWNGFGYGSWTPVPVQPVAPWGGYGVNKVINSGNGSFNTINAGSGGGWGGFLGNFVQSAFPGGVNVNVVKNSGNGTGNTINAGGGRPGAFNLNVISGSGNGTGNAIRLGR